MKEHTAQRATRLYRAYVDFMDGSRARYDGLTLVDLLAIVGTFDNLSVAECSVEPTPVEASFASAPVLYVVKTDDSNAGKGVLVTDDWNEAATDIQTKIERCRVTVEKVSHSDGGVA